MKLRSIIYLMSGFLFFMLAIECKDNINMFVLLITISIIMFFNIREEIKKFLYKIKKTSYKEMAKNSLYLNNKNIYSETKDSDNIEKITIKSIDDIGKIYVNDQSFKDNYKIKIENIEQSKSEEILEYIIKLQEYDNYYKKLPEEKKYLINELLEIKNNKLKEIVNKKFDKIRKKEDNYDILKSYLDELKYCSSRYPEYKKMLNTEILKVENYIEDLDNNLLTKTAIIKINIDNIDEMDGLKFEEYIKTILEKNGYINVVKTKASNDYGIDVLAEKDNIKYAIQCKNYSKPLGSHCVQEAYSGKQYYNCHVGVVITNNYFTKHAKDLADKNGILLWDRDELKKLMK